MLVVGSGPSLTGIDLPALLAGRGLRAVVAVKAAGFLAPEADVCVAADWRWTRRPLPWDRLAPPLYLAVDDDWDGPLPPGATLLRRWPQEQDPGRLSPDPRALAMGGTSGFAALNFAVLRGARRVVLLGYDYRHDSDGRHHAAPELHVHYRLHDARFWHWWTAPFLAARPALAAAGVTVLNATPGSALAAFPLVDLDAVAPRV